MSLPEALPTTAIDTDLIQIISMSWNAITYAAEYNNNFEVFDNKHQLLMVTN